MGRLHQRAARLGARDEEDHQGARAVEGDARDVGLGSERGPARQHKNRVIAPRLSRFSSDHTCRWTTSRGRVQKPGRKKSLSRGLIPDDPSSPRLFAAKPQLAKIHIGRLLGQTRNSPLLSVFLAGASIKRRFHTTIFGRILRPKRSRCCRSGFERVPSKPHAQAI